MVRVKERIPIIINKINWFDFITYLGFYNPQEIADKCIAYKKEIEEFWMQTPDLRLTQVLVIKDIVSNSPASRRTWYYTEETDYMIKNNLVKPEELLYWGSYGKDGKGPLKMIAINDMDSEHINACINTQKRMSENYRKIMRKVLRIRKLNTLNK